MLAALGANPGHTLRFRLPDGQMVPIHSHVTDVARVDKRFIDCGGTLRTTSACVLQIWNGSDTEHRLKAGRLVDVEVEYEHGYISQFPAERAEPQEGELLFHLGVKHTACLAEDQCMKPSAATSAITFRPIAG
jgi:hypothetical protein